MNKLWVTVRVTRLGEISPFGRCFENCKSSAKFLATFFHGTNTVLILAKYALGYILGDFFTNSSGHPGHRGQKTSGLSTREKLRRAQGCQMWYIFKPKFQIWVDFGGPWNGKRWYILCPFGYYYGHLVYFTVKL
jgi:hypothetical protein